MMIHPLWLAARKRLSKIEVLIAEGTNQKPSRQAYVERLVDTHERLFREGADFPMWAADTAWALARAHYLSEAVEQIPLHANVREAAIHQVEQLLSLDRVPLARQSIIDGALAAVLGEDVTFQMIGEKMETIIGQILSSAREMEETGTGGESRLRARKVGLTVARAKRVGE